MIPLHCLYTILATVFLAPLNIFNIAVHAHLTDVPESILLTRQSEILAAADVLDLEGFLRASFTARPEQGGERISQEWLESLHNRDCLWRFRFTAKELLELCNVLQLPETILTRSRYRADRLEALCLTCARLAHPGDIFDLVMKYNRSESAISEIINYTVCAIDIAWSRLLNFDHTHLLSPSNLAVYAAAIHAAGAPVSTVWGFIDCTLRRITRPSRLQQAAYSGYKRYHALKYQAVAIPNGMIAHLFGPYEGRHADPFLLSESGLLDLCAQYAVQDGSAPDAPPEQRYYQLFGDPAYGLGPHLLSPFSRPGQRSELEQE